MRNDIKYALIDIKEFVEKSAMVKGVYQYIIQSAWAVTSLTTNKFLGVGIAGISPVDLNTSTFPYIAWINGSTYIEHFCLLNDNVSIYKSLEVKNDLFVRGTTTFTDLILDNASIGKNLYVNNNIDVNNNLNVQKTTYLNDVNVLNNASINILNVSTIAFFNNVSIMNASIKNASIDTIYIKNASIDNASIDNVYIKNASIQYINISKADIYNLDVQNTSTINFSANTANIINVSINNASFNTIRVNQNVSVGNTITALTINSNNMSNSNNIFSKNIDIRNNASLNNAHILGKTTLYANILNNTPLNIYTNSTEPERPPDYAVNMDMYIYPPTFVKYLIAEVIVCDTIRPRGSDITSYVDIGLMSITRQIVQNVDGTFLLGTFTRPIIYNSYTNGVLSHGIGNTIDTDYIGTSTFDLSANSNTIGIMYNGPVNIGTKTPNIFNLNATGNMSYVGIVDISGSSKISGNLNVTNDILLGGNITSYSDIKLKDNITKLSDCLNKIDHINGYSYTRNDLNDTSKQYIGLIAQEVETMYPEIVENKDNIKSINYQSVIAILVECIKELKSEINKLKS
jgi:hypothetical protein